MDVIRNQKEIELEEEDCKEKYLQFLGEFNHELRTPLMAIQGFVYTLIDGASKDKDLLDRYLSRIEVNVERMLSLVEDLDSLDKMSRLGKDIVLKAEDLDILIEKVIASISVLAKENKVALRFKDETRGGGMSIKVMCNASKIQQVLVNLIVNAINYKSLEREAYIDIITTLESNKVKIEVKDNSIGIEKEHLEHIFERFYRVNKSKDMVGSGLGLTIAKEIVKAHNYDITVKSDFGIGSVFAFYLEKAI